MPSIFSRIISGELPAYKVAENQDFLAFLDINPLALGHTLVIPKLEVDYVFDLEESHYLALHSFARRVALALDKAVPSQRIATTIVGLEVPHVHIHLVPLAQGMGFINFAAPRPTISKEEMTSLAARIAAQMA